MIFIIIWFDIASEEIELNANPFNPFFMSDRFSSSIPKIPKSLKNLIIFFILFINLGRCLGSL